MKILINIGAGCFGLSERALEAMYNAGVKGIKAVDAPGGKLLFWCDNFEFQRNDSIAIEIVEKIGLEQSAGNFCVLTIVEIPDNIERWDVITSDFGLENLIYGSYKWYGEN